MISPSRERWDSLKEASIKKLAASEQAVERQFHAMRLVGTLAAGLFLVGFLLVAQWRGVATHTNIREVQGDQDLAFIVHELGAENDELRRETLRLEQRIAEAERRGEDQVAILNQAARELQALRVLTGIVGATGPGVEVHISDRQAVLLPRDYADLVNELRAAGAEAISIGRTRVSATSGFSRGEIGVTLDDNPVWGDTVVHAIGEPGTLAQALQMPGGLVAALRSFPGVDVTVFEHDALEVPAAQISQLEIGSASDEDE